MYRLLNIICNFFDAINNKKVVGGLDKNSLLNDKQYDIRPTADILTTITHRISEALSNKSQGP